MPGSRLSARQAVASGALAGAIAANTMTVLRMAARRRGVIQKTVPQLVEEWLVRRLAVDLPGGHLAHHALDQVLHVGMGALLGALDGAYFYWRRPPTAASGVALGVASWAFTAGVMLPALGAIKPVWRASLPEVAVNLGAHVLFGVSTALLTEELFAELDHGPTPYATRVATPTG